MKKQIIIIGSRFSAISASCYLEKLIPVYQVYFDRLDSLLISNKIEEICEVVWDNNNENLNIRLLTTPVEDAVYTFNMLYPSLLLIEFFKKKFNKE